MAEVTQRCKSLLHLAQLVRYKITVLTNLVMGSMILLGWLLQEEVFALPICCFVAGLLGLSGNYRFAARIGRRCEGHGSPAPSRSLRSRVPIFVLLSLGFPLSVF